MAFTETFKNIYAAEKHISVATAIKYIQENHFIDPILKNAVITLQQQSLLPLSQELTSCFKMIWKNSKHKKEYHFGNTEIDIEVDAFFIRTIL